MMLEQGASGARAYDRILRLFPSPRASGPFDAAKVYLRRSPRSRSGSRLNPRFARKSSLSPSDMFSDRRPRCRGWSTSGSRRLGYRLHRQTLHPRPRRRTTRRTRPIRAARGRGAEKEFRRHGRRDPQVGQGEVHRLLDPPQATRGDHSGCGRRGGVVDSDHAPVRPPGGGAGEGHRRLNKGPRTTPFTRWHRVTISDVAGRRPVPRATPANIIGGARSRSGCRP